MSRRSLEASWKRLFRSARESSSQARSELDAELEALRSGLKAMSLFSFPDDVGEDDPLYKKLQRLSSSAGLAFVRVTEAAGPGLNYVRVYISHTEELWRVHAHIALKRVYLANADSWSFGAEALEGHLLGYSPEEIAAWQAECRWRRVNWLGETVYLLMKRQHQSGLNAVGGRCLTADSLSHEILAIRTSGAVVRADAHERMLVDQTLARAAMDFRFAVAFFEKAKFVGKSGLRSRVITQNDLAHFNAALRSELQVLGPNGWH